MCSKTELKKKVQRLESENKVLRQIVKETIKALENVQKLVSITTLDTVAYVTSPYKNERRPIQDPFRSCFGDC